MKYRVPRYPVWNSFGLMVCRREQPFRQHERSASILRHNPTPNHIRRTQMNHEPIAFTSHFSNPLLFCVCVCVCVCVCAFFLFSLHSNSQAVVAPLDRILTRAEAMFSSRAFVHHYARGGLCEADFSDAFRVLEQQLFDYKSLQGSG